MSTLEPTAISLTVAIGRLYRAFSSYRPAHPLTGCPHCTSEADDRRLRSRPLRDLTPDDLDRFAFKAMTTLGTVNDFKHFLPRLFEIVISADGFGSTDPEILFGKITYGEWQKWKPVERDAITGFLQALWIDTLTNDRPAFTADVALCCIGNVVDDLGPFLNIWRSHPTPKALRQLAELIDSNSHSLTRHGVLWNSFWNDRETQMRQAAAWVLSDATYASLETAFFEADASDTALLSQAVEQLTVAHHAAANRM